MFIVTVEFLIATEHLDKFLPAMLENARLSLSEEPACEVFDVCQDAADPKRIFLYEIYRTAADFDIHLQSPHFLSFNKEVADWVLDKKVETWNKKNKM